MALHNVLLVSYIFPPSGGVGVQRALGYVRHLPEHGCRVFVVAARGGSCPVFDPSLLKLVPPVTVVQRTFTPELSYAVRDRVWKTFVGAKPSRPASKTAVSPAPAAPAGGWKSRLSAAAERVFFPDPQVVWTPFAVRAATRLVRQNDIGTVLVTAPPFSALGVGLALKRRFPHLRLISEFRDAWLDYYLGNFSGGHSETKRRLATDMELAVMRASDYVVAVTPAQRDAMRTRYPSEAAEKFIAIPNGYDSDAYAAFQPSRAERRNVVITYYGSLYASPPYDITGFLNAVDSLPDELRNNLELRFIGRIAREAEPLLEGRKTKIVKLGFLPRNEGIRWLEQSDYLLVAANDPTQHAGKLFDYLATGLPVIALSPPSGEVARLLRETGGGVAVDGFDVAAIREVVLDAFTRVRGEPNRFPVYNRDAITAYDRKNLVAELVRQTGIAKPQEI